MCCHLVKHSVFVVEFVDTSPKGAAAWCERCIGQFAAKERKHNIGIRNEGVQ